MTKTNEPRQARSGRRPGWVRRVVTGAATSAVWVSALALAFGCEKDNSAWDEALAQDADASVVSVSTESGGTTTPTPPPVNPTTATSSRDEDTTAPADTSSTLPVTPET